MLSAAVSMLRAGKKVVLASVIQTKGSVPGKVGAKLLLTKSGEEFVIDGTVGGAGLEMKVIEKLSNYMRGIRKLPVWSKLLVSTKEQKAMRYNRLIHYAVGR